MTQQVEVDDDEFAEHIAIGVHTGLRKGTDAPDSAALWRAIGASTDTSWGDAARFCVYGIKSMGYKLVKEVE
jgi:hypothetical protein